MIYDTANQLAKEMRETEEYLNFKKAKESINANQEYKGKIDNFEKLRYEEQLGAMTTGKTDEQKMANIQNIYKELINVPEIKQYFDAELKFNILLGDVNKIISESVKDVMC